MKNMFKNWLSDLFDFSMKEEDSSNKKPFIVMPTEENEELFKEVSTKMNKIEEEIKTASSLDSSNKSLEKAVLVLVEQIKLFREELNEQKDMLMYVASIVDGSLEEAMEGQEHHHTHECNHDDNEEIQEDDDEMIDFDDEELFQQEKPISTKKLNLN